MNCRDFRSAHLEYTDGTLSPEGSAEAQAHREGCADCARFDALVRRSLMLVHSLPPIAPDPRSDPKIIAQRARRRGVPSRARFAAPRTLAAASVAFLAGVGSTALFLRHTAGPVASLPPVVAVAAPPAPRALSAPGIPMPGSGGMRPDFMASAAGGMPLWPAATLIDEAPARFVSVQLTSPVPAR